MTMNENKVKEKYMEYQLLMQQFQQLQENIGALEKHILELRVLDDNLSSLSKTKAGEETLMPLGSGIFVKGELKDNSNVVMNVGGGVCVEKSVDEAKDTVSIQLSDVTNVFTELQEEIMKTSEKLQSLQDEFKNMRMDELGEA